MEQLDQLSLHLTAWLQATYPQLEGAMLIVSGLGQELFYLIVLPIFYWVVNKRAARFLGYIFLTGVLINNILKNVFRLPRPYWIAPELGLTEEPLYGLPSGHVEFAVIIYVFIAYWFRRWWLWLLAVFLIGLFMFNRLYLGAHFLTDVLAGLLVGTLTLVAFFLWQYFFSDRFGKQILGRRLLTVLIVPFALTAIYVALLLILGEPDMTVSWAEYIPAAELVSREGVVSTFAALTGFAMGILLEGSRIRFRVEGSIWQRLARILIGVPVAVAIWAGLDAIFPADPFWLAVPFRFLRYFLLLLWVTYFAPWVFVRLGLAEADPEPEIKVAL